jgi:hypothetical protein
VDRRKLRFGQLPDEDRVTVRLRDGEANRLRQIANHHDMTLSELLREGAEAVAAVLEAAPSKDQRSL